jgi:DNA mismatch repair ATPase MutL
MNLNEEGYMYVRLASSRSKSLRISTYINDRVMVVSTLARVARPTYYV